MKKFILLLMVCVLAVSSFAGVYAEPETDEPVAIIIAPNGAGKTTILNFINFMLCPTVENFNTIKFIPIKLFQCCMTDGKIITYERLTDQEIEENRNQIKR